MEWCLHRLREFDGGRSERAWEIVSGNETFVYQYDLKTKQQSAVWLFPGGNPPVAFKRSRSTLKRIIAVFFAKSGYVASVPLQERKTVNTECYINTCLPKVSEAWSVRRPNAYQAPRAALLHDEESAPTATATVDYLEATRVQLVSQSPYSPGLAPCEFFLFPPVKQQLKKKQFQGVEDA